MKRAAFVFALALTYNGTGIACGHCTEDRIAAVYDHAQLQHAAAHQQACF